MCCFLDVKMVTIRVFLKDMLDSCHICESWAESDKSSLTG